MSTGTRPDVRSLAYKVISTALEQEREQLAGTDAEEAHKLSDLLGDHHDLAVLVEDALERAPDDADTEELKRLARRRQRELLDAAIPIGERLYAEKPEQFRRRVKIYWQTWARAGEV